MYRFRIDAKMQDDVRKISHNDRLIPCMYLQTALDKTSDATGDPLFWR